VDVDADADEAARLTLENAVRRLPVIEARSQVWCR